MCNGKPTLLQKASENYTKKSSKEEATAMGKWFPPLSRQHISTLCALSEAVFA